MQSMHFDSGFLEKIKYYTRNGSQHGNDTSCYYMMALNYPGLFTKQNPIQQISHVYLTELCTAMFNRLNLCSCTFFSKFLYRIDN